MLSNNSDKVFKLSPAEIGQRIRERREQNKQSQADLGHACGLSQNGVMKIERGEVENSRFVPVIWKYLGLDLGELGGVFEQTETLAHVEVKVPIRVLLIKEISYQPVDMPGTGSGKGILITWRTANGTTVSGVMDRVMLEQAFQAFSLVTQRHAPDTDRAKP